MSFEIRIDLYDMLERYSHYGWSRKAICRKWEISLKTFSSLKKAPAKTDGRRRTPLNAVTREEKQRVIAYALTHTGLNHREMTYRMIDEDVAFMSSSSVYRILRENNLLPQRRQKEKPVKWNPHARLSAPDEVWQTDLMILQFRNRDFYLLSYFDVYSRYVVHHELCTAMSGDSIRQASERAVTVTGKKPANIQSDNGSCFISAEYRSFVNRLKIEHRRIHAHCPNENAEIERYHRTLRELIDPDDAGTFEALHELVKERIRYYNHDRYHSAIGWVPPQAAYIGKADEIFESRNRKLKKAKELRIRENLEQRPYEKLHLFDQAA